MSNTLDNKVIDMIIEIECLGEVEAATLTADTKLRKDLGMDSLDDTMLAIELEDLFDIRIIDSEVNEWVTIQDVVNDVHSKTRGIL